MKSKVPSVFLYKGLEKRLFDWGYDNGNPMTDTELKDLKVVVEKEVARERRRVCRELRKFVAEREFVWKDVLLAKLEKMGGGR